MTTITINGPAIRKGLHNVVLREALIHSPSRRLSNANSYHRVRVGVREGQFTSWIGTWNQATQKLEAASPQSILDEGQRSRRMKSGQAIVIEIKAEGTPPSLSGCRLDLRFAQVGGRGGQAKPLVNSGAQVADPNSRSAIVTLERQINGGLSEWEDSVQLIDPVSLAGTGTFQGRMQRDSSTQISVQRYNGNWIEVDGEAVSIGDDGLSITTSDPLVEASGGVGSSTPGANTLYYVYVSASGIRLSGTAPSRYRGVYYLGDSGSARLWRFVGWVRTDASTQFVDDETDRLVVNYYNRLRTSVLLTPDYNDNNGPTTYTTTSTTWVVKETGSYIANGEDTIHLFAFAVVDNSGANLSYVGIGENSSTDAGARS